MKSSSTGGDINSRLNQTSRRIQALLVFHHSDLRSAQDPAIELEALLLHVKDGIVLLALLVWIHEQGLVLVGVELFPDRIKSLQAVLLESVHEDVLGHLQTLVQVGQVLQLFGLFFNLELVLGNHGQRAVQVVDAINQVLGEALDRKLACVLDFALGAVLKVTEVGNGTEAFIL